MLLKVHPSNYRIEGFTRRRRRPRHSPHSRAHETCRSSSTSAAARWSTSNASACRTNPPSRETLAQGADIVTFSGDKLLGSVQAGLIVGRRDLIERIKRNPLKRALRCDKITLAILHYTLRLYQDPERLAAELPLLATLTRPLAASDGESRIAIATMLAHRLARHPFDRRNRERAVRSAAARCRRKRFRAWPCRSRHRPIPT